MRERKQVQRLDQGVVGAGGRGDIKAARCRHLTLIFFGILLLRAHWHRTGSHLHTSIITLILLRSCPQGFFHLILQTVHGVAIGNVSLSAGRVGF